MSERSLMSWANLEASLKFPTDLLDPNSRFSNRLPDCASNSEGILRANEDDDFAAGLFGLENTVNFCDVAARLPLTAQGVHFGSESKETEVSAWAPNATLEKKGLRRMAGLLLRTILNRRFCSHQEVAAEVERLLPATGERGEPKEEKNIRRRVYDALNVMIAAGVLERELEGTYRSAATRLHFHNSPLASRRNQMQNEIDQQTNRIARKRELQAKTHSKLQAVRRCLDRNRNNSSPTASRLDFPLVALVQTGRRRVRVEAEEEQLALWHPCLAIYSETDLLEEVWLSEQGACEVENEATGCKLEEEYMTD